MLEWSLTLTRFSYFPTFPSGGWGLYDPPPAVSNESIIPLRDKNYRITLEEISQLTIPIAFDPGPIFDLGMSMTSQRPNFRKIGDLSNFSIFSSAAVADINMRSSLASFLMNLGHFGV